MKTYTICNRVDGFGAQYLAIMSCYAFCYNNENATYIHTPFKKLCHGESVEKLNKFIGFPINNSIPKKIDFKNRYISAVHWSPNPDIFYTDEVKNMLLLNYYSNKKPNINKIDIAIHIRRGDVNSNNLKTSYRYTSNDIYIKIIKYLKKIYPKYKITIFSEGDKKDFEFTKNLDVILEINTDLEKTYHSFVKAKVLVTAISALSYSAALLNKNIIYYIPMKHKPLKNWNVIDFEKI